MNPIEKTEYGGYTIESESYETAEREWEGVECKPTGRTVTTISHAIMTGTFVHREFRTIEEAKKWIDMRPLVKPHNDKIQAKMKANDLKESKIRAKIQALEKQLWDVRDQSDDLAGKLL